MKIRQVFWAEPSTVVIKPKSKGSGINVSDFIDDHIMGFYNLAIEQYNEANVSNPNIKLVARTLSEYGEKRQCFWTADTFFK